MVNKTNLFLVQGVWFKNELNPYEIIYLKAESNYTHIFLKDGTHKFFCKTMKNFESYLPIGFFLRTHRSYVVNKSYIKTINSDKITLTNSTDIPVSRRQKKYIKHVMYKHHN